MRRRDRAAATTRLAASEARPRKPNRNRSRTAKILGHIASLFRGDESPEPPTSWLLIWESELRAIGADARAWSSVETGGDLFGRWDDTPIVFLATKAGPAARRDHAHFRLDVDYLRDLSEKLASPWALRYFGDWHSHHRLGLSSPSGGDRRRIRGLARRNQFSAMCEGIVTLEGAPGDPIIRIHPWLYDLQSDDELPVHLGLRVLPGVSPVREALYACGSLPEQDLTAWESVSLSKIRVGGDAGPPVLESQLETDDTTTDAVLLRLAEALQASSGTPVEQHTTEFGWVTVVHLSGSDYLALAIGSSWPLPVLEVHLLNRDEGTTKALDGVGGLTALKVPRLVELYERVDDEQGVSNVDS